MTVINPKQILVFYDEPILFTATDAVESLYLCLLSSIPDEYDCTAIRISHGRLTEYLSKRVDLRAIFTNPEIPGEYFRVPPDGEERLILSPLDAKDLTEDRLPEEGDFIQKIRYNMGYRPYNEVTAKACEDARNGISAGRVDTSSFEAFLRSVLDE